jgi:tetratricopeptide (TPR) repeat protein
MSDYAAFISYSHSDEAAVRWLHRAIETFTMPRALVGSSSEFGPVSRRLPPVFRDRDELVASSDLGERLRAALAASRFQIVVCSPRAAQSKWVNEEILTFKRLHGESRVLAVIVAGEPYAAGEAQCFPLALRYCLDANGELSGVPAEPIAADMRPGKDGKRLALLKLIAGIAGVRLDALVRRDAARRQRSLVAIAAISTTIAVLTIGLAIYAEGQRRIAVRQQQLADRSLDFLISTFSIANPATENPRTITAFTILKRASSKAARELPSEPGVSARLLRATGEIYANLGLPAEAERDLALALSRLPPSGEERARTLLKLATVAYKRGDQTASARAISQAQTAIDPQASYAQELEAAVLEQRGLTAILSGRYEESATLLADAARRYRSLDGDNREALGRIEMTRAQSLLRIGRPAEAERLFERAEASYRSAFGLNHVRTANAVQNHALADFEQGRIDRAAKAIDQAVAIYDRVLDHNHPSIGAALILMGRIRTAQRDYPGALQALDRARSVYVRLYGDQNPAVGDTDFYAADAEAGAGRTDAALVRLARTKAIYDSNYGPVDPDQLELLTSRAGILLAGGRPNEARRDCILAAAMEKRLKSADVRPDAMVSCHRMLGRL